MSKKHKVLTNPRGIMSMEDFIRPPKKDAPKGSKKPKTGTLDKINKLVK